TESGVHGRTCRAGRLLRLRLTLLLHRLGPGRAVGAGGTGRGDLAAIRAASQRAARGHPSRALLRTRAGGADARAPAGFGGRGRPVLDENRREAESIGVNAIPAHIFGGRYLVVGAHPYELFLQVVERLRTA